jgi:methyl-accepting chemotaxis protein
MRGKVLGLVGFACVLTATVIVAAILVMVNGVIADAERRELESHYRAVLSEIDREASRAVSMATLVAQIPSAAAALAAGDREGLARSFVPGFAVLNREHGVAQYQFHTPHATSFLRVHRPDRFGDDLSGFRQTVVETNRAQRAIAGMEFGIDGLGIRGVVPVRHDGRHVGSVELGLNLGAAFFEAFKRNTGVDVALTVIENDRLRGFASTFGERRFFADADYPAIAASTPRLTHGEIGDRPVAVIAGPVRDYSGRGFGVLELAVDGSSYVAARARMRDWALAIGFAALAASLFCGWLVLRSLCRPMQRLTQVMRALAAGDVSVAVPAPASGDEIGQMAETVAVFKQNAIDKQRAEQEAAAQKERAEAEKRAARARMAAEFERSVGGVVATIATAAGSMQSSAKALSATAEETSRQSTVVTAASNQASTNVQTVASAAEELNASVTEISRQVGSSTQIAGQAVDEATRTNATVEGLANAAEKIGDVVRLINDIAGQTNLLALNATIEAARAGEAGKGFAVVATEVKSLATQTAKATEEIGGQVAAIRSATADAVAAISGIGKTIGQLNEVATAIASAVEEQGAATREIARNVQQAAVGTNEVSSNIAGVSQAAGQTGSAATLVLDAAGQLAGEAQTLRAAVDRFLAEVRAA